MADEYSSDDEVPTLFNLDGPQSPPDESMSPVVPVTILTGFLGSGKTTLIQYILRSPNHGRKIAVIENEYSGASAGKFLPNQIQQMGPEAEKEGLSIETLIARDGTDNSNLTDMIELPNGCICCTVKDSLVETLELLLDKKRELDYILIECSGMANPGPIASIFWLDAALESRLRLDGIVACVDAKNIGMELRETSSSLKLSSKGSIHKGSDGGGDEAAQQIAFADRIIVNKIDLLSSECREGEKTPRYLFDIVEVIRSINGTAPIRTTTFSQIPDLEWILDAQCFEIEKARAVELEFMLREKNYNDSHTHTNSIGTLALIEEGSVDLKKMNTWLASVLWPDQDEHDRVLKAQLDGLEKLNQITTEELIEHRRKKILGGSMHIFRVKGILSVIHPFGYEDERMDVIEENGLDKRRYIVQAVNDLWDILPASDSLNWSNTLGAPEERISKLVVIGRHLDRKELMEGFKSCFIR